MNVKLLRKIKRHILAQPKRFDMNFIGTRDMKSFKPNRVPECGTIGCIAGWACALSGKKFSGRIARNLLGLDYDQTERLFYDNPKGFRGMWRGDGKAATAKLAAKRIDLFIKTKGAE